MIIVCTAIKDGGYRRGATAAVVLGSAAGQLLYFYVIYFRNVQTILLSIGLSSALLVLLYVCITVAQQYMEAKTRSKPKTEKQALPDEDEKLMKLTDIIAMAHKPPAGTAPLQERRDEARQGDVQAPVQESQQGPEHELQAAAAAMDSRQDAVKKMVLDFQQKEPEDNKADAMNRLRATVQEGQRDEAVKCIFKILGAGYDLDEGERHKLNVLLLALREETK